MIFSKNNVTDSLMRLEQACFFHLEKATEYSYDYKIKEQDYSREYAFSEAIYAYEKYRRALETVVPNVQWENNLDFFRDNILDSVKESNLLSVDRFKKFFGDYFSSLRYEELISNTKDQVKSIIGDKQGENDRTLEDYVSEVCDLVLIRDKIEHFCRADGILLQDVLNQDGDAGTITQFVGNLRMELVKVYDDYYSLWNLFRNDIINLRSSLLIPFNNEKWWFEIQPLTSQVIENQMSTTLEQKKENSFLEEMVRHNDPEKEMNKFDVNIPECLEWLRQNSAEVNNLLGEVLSYPDIKPSFYVYSTSEDKGEIPFDRLLHAVQMKEQIILDLVEELQRDKGKIVDSDRRRHVIATALFIVNKKEAASDILDKKD